MLTSNGLLIYSIVQSHVNSATRIVFMEWELKLDLVNVLEVYLFYNRRSAGVLWIAPSSIVEEALVTLPHDGLCHCGYLMILLRPLDM